MTFLSSPWGPSLDLGSLLVPVVCRAGGEPVNVCTFDLEFHLYLVFTQQQLGTW